MPRLQTQCKFYNTFSARFSTSKSARSKASNSEFELMGNVPVDKSGRTATNTQDFHHPNLLSATYKESVKVTGFPANLTALLQQQRVCSTLAARRVLQQNDKVYDKLIDINHYG